MTTKGTDGGGADGWATTFLNPIVVLAILILLSLFVMIGAAIFGIDNGFLNGMARTNLARGLITYLFAVVTIGIAVALVLSALVGPRPTDENDSRFQRGKEILSLLLGVFGTIVGFYFGSESAKEAEEPQYEVSTMDLSPQPVGPAGVVTVRAVVKGGSPPYRFGLTEGSGPVEEVRDLAYEGGWVVKQLQLAPLGAGQTQTIHLVVEDSTGKRLEQAVPVRRSAQD